MLLLLCAHPQPCHLPSTVPTCQQHEDVSHLIQPTHFAASRLNRKPGISASHLPRNKSCPSLPFCCLCGNARTMVQSVLSPMIATNVSQNLQAIDHLGATHHRLIFKKVYRDNNSQAKEITPIFSLFLWCGYFHNLRDKFTFGGCFYVILFEIGYLLRFFKTLKISLFFIFYFFWGGGSV